MPTFIVWFFCRVVRFVARSVETAFSPPRSPSRGVPHSFMRLEPRRVLSVNAAFAGGSLQVTIANDGIDGTTASLQQLSADQFFVDTNSDNSLNAGEVSGLIADLRQISVSGDAGTGDFFWTGDFTTSPLDQPLVNVVDLNSLNIANVSATAFINGHVSIDAANTTINGSLNIDGNLSVNNVAPNSMVLLEGNSEVTVTGSTSFNVDQFDQAAGSVLTGTQNISLHVGDQAFLNGTIESTAGSIHIESSGAGISMSDTASLDAFDSVSLVAEDSPNGSVTSHTTHASGNVLISASDEVIANGPITSDGGNLSIISDRSVFINDTLSTSGNGTVFINADDISVDGDIAAESDIIIDATNEISIAGSVESTSGQIALESGRDLQLQSASSISGIGVLLNVGEDLTGDGSVVSDADIVASVTGDALIRGSFVADSGNAVISAGGTISVGYIEAQNVSLIAGGSIQRANTGVSGTNLQAEQLQLVSLAGGIGAPDSGNGTPAVNSNAIGIDVSTLAARAVNGIYIDAKDSLTIGSITAFSSSVAARAFRIPTTDEPIAPIDRQLQLSSNSAVQEGLVSTSGVAKVNVTGDLIILDGADVDTLAVSARGDVLLRASQSITVRGGVQSSLLNIELHSTNSIAVNSQVTAKSGSIYIHSNIINLNNDVNSGSDLLVDAGSLLNVNAIVSSSGGQVGLKSGDDINVTSGLISGAGVYLNAGDDITLTSSIDSSVDVVLIANDDVTMTGQVSAVGVLGIRANDDIRLGELSGTAVTLTAGDDIFDNNGATVNVRADRLQMVAGGMIGTSSLASPVDTNPSAIDLMVGTVAARAVDGVYLQELASANADLAIGEVGTITASVTAQVNRVNFNSFPASAIAPASGTIVSSPAATEGLKSTTGPIKVYVEAGSLVIQDGVDLDTLSVNASGDVLLRASNSITINGDVQSALANVELHGTDSILIDSQVTVSNGTLYIHANIVNVNAEISSGGDLLVDAGSLLGVNANVSSSGGQIGLRSGGDINFTSGLISGVGVYLNAGDDITLNGSIDSDADVVLIASDDVTMTGQVSALGVLGIRADDDIRLGELSGTAVTLTASDDILDNNGAVVNVRADRMQMAAGGTIGTSSLASPVDTNPAAIDLMVGTVAARSVDGIYLQELTSANADLTIGEVGTITANVAVQVNRVNFNSSQASAIAPVSGTIVSNPTATEGLISTTGPIKVYVEAGNLIVQDGADVDTLGVNSAGDVLLRASKSVTISGDVQSSLANVELRCTDTILINSQVTASNGTLYVHATDVTINAKISSGGDLLVDANNLLSVNANLSSNNGQVGLTSGRNLSISAVGTVQGDGVYLGAGNNLTLAGSIASTADTVIVIGNDLVMAGQASANGVLAIQAGNDIQLGEVAASAVTLAADNDILDNNGATVNVRAGRLQMVAGDTIGTSSLASPVDTNPSAIDLMVGTVAARAVDGIYLQELASANSDLTIGDVGSIAGSVTVQVNRVNFNSSPASSIAPVTGSLVGDTAFREGLTSTTGAIKVYVEAGNLIVQDGTDADTLGVNASGDVLLRASNSINIAGEVRSDFANVELRAADSILINNQVTASNGTLYIHANAVNVNADMGSGGDLLVDAGSLINVNANVSSSGGQTGLSSGGDINVTSGLVSGAGVYLNTGDDITLNGSIDSDADVVLIASDDVTMTGQTLANGAIAIRAGDDIRLGELQGTAVTLTAGDDILDNNVATVNVRAGRLQMVAGGSIGNSSLVSPVDTNPTAIDLMVGTVTARAVDGIYLQELASGNADLTIGEVGTITASVTVQVNRVNFNSSPASAIAPLIGTVVSDAAAGEGLVSTAGVIKVKVDDGRLVVADGADADTLGVQSGSDILLWSFGQLSIQGGVQSIVGDVTFRSDSDVVITNTGYLSTSATALISGDAVTLNGVVSANAGLLIQANDNVTLNANVQSQFGSIGIISGGSVFQNANLDAGKDLQVRAQGDYAMLAGVTSDASGNLVIVAGDELRLSVLNAANVAMQAGGNIIDAANDVAPNIVANQVSIRAGGSIGQAFVDNGSPDQNVRAIDLDATTINTVSGAGTYLRQAEAGGNLRVGPVGPIAADIGVLQANFNSSKTPVRLPEGSTSLAALDNSNAGGVYKLVVSNGSLAIQNTLTASSDILLNATESIDVTGAVQSTAGHVHINATNAANISGDLTAGQHVLLQGNTVDVVGTVASSESTLIFGTNGVNVSGAISGANLAVVSSNGNVTQTGQLIARGDVLINADLGSYQMNANASTSAGADAIVSAANGITITRFSANESAAFSTSLGNILGVERGSANITANNLLLIASKGRIGSADNVGEGFNDISYNSVNVNALDINVASTLAAKSQAGIYLSQRSAESNTLHIGRVEAINIALSAVDVNFNSTKAPVPIAKSVDALEYINTNNSQANFNRAVDLRNQNGSIMIDDAVGRSVDGIHSRNGSIYLSANANPSDNGSILLGESIRTLGNGDRGNIGLRSSNWISESNSRVLVVGTNLSIQSGTFTHLSHTSVDTLNADVGAVGTLKDFQQINERASNLGDDFLNAIDMPGQNNDGFYTGDRSPDNSVDPAHFRFGERLQDQYSLFLVNDKQLIVNTVTAEGDAPNVYLETKGANDLIVQGFISTLSSTDTEGAIVLVAGGDFTLGTVAGGSTGQLMTSSVLSGGQLRFQVVNQFGSNDFILNVNAFEGGDGIEPRSEFTSTEFVIDKGFERLTRLSLQLADADLRNRTDVYQRVVMQFGSSGESGFDVYIRYADGFGQEFDTIGDVGVRTILNVDNTLPQNDNSIDARLASDNRAAVFSRIIAFQTQFLFANETLPTLGVIRRADDFFMFQNAADDSAIVDMTYETFKVDNVKGRGAEIGFTELPQDIAQVIPPPIIPPPEVSTLPTSQIFTSQVELPFTLEKNFEIAIYRVHFDDLNQDGYAGDNELPNNQDVLNAQKVDLDGESESSEPKQGVRVKVGSLSTGTGAPTGQQIEAFKAQLMNNPNTPTGAYSIVETDVNEKETVLDIFSIRDESAQDEKDDDSVPLVRPLQQPPKAEESPEGKGDASKPDEDDGAQLVSPVVDDQNQNTAMSSSTVVGGALWLAGLSRRSGQSLLEQIGGDSSSETYRLNRSARRARKILSTFIESTKE